MQRIAVVAVIDKAPDKTCRDICQNVRQEENETKSHDARNAMGQHRRKPDCQRDLYADRNHDDQRIVDQRLRKGSIAKQNLKILQPNKLARRTVAIPTYRLYQAASPIGRITKRVNNKSAGAGISTRSARGHAQRSSVSVSTLRQACQRRSSVHGNIGHLIRFRIHAVAIGAVH